MRSRLSLLVLFTLFALSSCFKISEVLDYTVMGFKKVAAKFGEKIWIKNNTESEETVMESTDIVMTPEIYKAGLDTILDLTKNPQRQK